MVTIGTKGMNVTDFNAAYRQSFGMMQDGTAYNAGMSRQYKSHSMSETTKAFIEESGLAEY